MDIDIVQVPVHLIKTFEEDLSRLIQSGLDRGPPKWRAEDIIKQAKENHVQIFVAIDEHAKIQACCTTMVNQYPLAKVMEVMQLGSDVTMDELEPLFKRLTEWAKETGCDYTELYGRKGWVKLLEDHEHTGCHLVKYLR